MPQKNLYIVSLLLSCVACAIVQVDPSLTGNTCSNSICPTIRDAIEYADFQDVIELLPGVYKGDNNKNFHLDEYNITLKSQSGSPADTIIDLENNGIFIQSQCTTHNCTLYLDGISVVNGGNGSAASDPNQQRTSILFLNKTAAYIHNCIFAGNLWSAIATSNSLYVDDGVDLVIKNCTFRNNTRSIVIVGVTPLTIDTCVFTGTASTLGEAIFFGNYYGFGYASVISNCVFSNFVGTGALIVGFPAYKLDLVNLTFSSNIANSLVYFYGCDLIKFTNSLFTKNKAQRIIFDFGGNIMKYNGINFIDNQGSVTVRSFVDADYTFSNCMFNGNIGDNAALNIFADLDADPAFVTVTSCTFESNRISAEGAVYINGPFDTFISNNTFRNNNGILGTLSIELPKLTQVIIHANTFFGNVDNSILAPADVRIEGDSLLIGFYLNSFQCSGRDGNMYPHQIFFEISPQVLDFSNNTIYSCLVTTITDQKATAGLPFSYRINRKSSVLLRDPERYSSVELTPKVTVTNNATYDPVTRLFQWKPNAVGDKSSVRVVSGLQTIDFDVVAVKEATPEQIYYVTPNSYFSYSLGDANNCIYGYSTIIQQKGTTAPVDWLTFDINNCQVSGTVPDTLGIFYIEVLVATGGRAVSLTLYVSNFTLDAYDIEGFSTINATITSVSPQNQATISLFVDSALGSFGESNSVTKTDTTANLNDFLANVKFSPTEQCVHCYFSITLDDSNGPILQRFVSATVAPNNKQKLSSGAIAGIVVGAVVGLVMITAIILFFIYKRKQAHQKSLFEMVEAIDDEQYKMENVIIKEILGAGNFGEVYRGEHHSAVVALKKVKSREQMAEFSKEVAVLCKLRHPHIVSFLGIYTDQSQEKYLVTEFMSHGNLLSIVSKETLKAPELLEMARQAASGMSYLAEKKVVHRDLSLRNLLVSAGTSSSFRYVVKVADFGLSRAVNLEASNQKDLLLPVKWTAPESLKHGSFTTQSDVWSYGISLWELFSEGRTPYPGMTNVQTIEKVEAGYRMEKPAFCSDEVYQLMMDCWKTNPADRPQFSVILSRLEQIIKRQVASTPQLTQQPFQPSKKPEDNNLDLGIYN